MQNLQQLFQNEEIGGSFSPERFEQIEHALIEDRRSDLPWYFRFIIGLGAWLASAFFISFFIVLIGFEENHRLTFGISGLVLLVLSTVVFRLKSGHFVSQCCLAASLAGQFMIYLGFLPEHQHFLRDAVILSIGLAVMLYGLYPDLLQRLITCLAALQITLAWIYLGDKGWLVYASNSIYSVLLWTSSYWVLHLAALVGCLTFVSRWSVRLAPLGYALVLSLAGWELETLGGIWVRQEINPYWNVYHDQAKLLSLFWAEYIRPICTAILLIAVIVWAAGGPRMLQKFSLPFISFALVIIAIIWLGAGGVLLPLVFIILGLFLESRVIQTIGLLLLPLFLFNYYYNLRLDLLIKSLALIGSGVALLLLRTGLKFWLTANIQENL